MKCSFDEGFKNTFPCLHEDRPETFNTSRNACFSRDIFKGKKKYLGEKKLYNTKSVTFSRVI